MKTKNLQSWNLIFREKGIVDELSSDGKNFNTNKISNYLVRGNGLSYGDSSFCDDGLNLLSHKLNSILKFNKDTGIIKAQAGATLADILNLTIKDNWILPILPSTKHVTLGGALAHDIHSRNHLTEGTFGHHVLSFELQRSDKQKMVCSPNNNRELFKSTIGGLGLTGAILWVELQLKKIPSHFIETNYRRFSDFSEGLDLLEKSLSTNEHNGIWFDLIDKSNKIRGVVFSGNYCHKTNLKSKNVDLNQVKTKNKISPLALINPFSAKVFNKIFFYKHKFTSRKNFVHFNNFFFKLDFLSNWNLLIGRKGFYQLQFSLPLKKVEHIEEILNKIKLSDETAFLGILKRFGDKPSIGIMSFPSEGYTLAIDFINKGESTKKFLNQIYNYIQKNGGRIYLAKDSIMGHQEIQNFYPNWNDFIKYKDSNFKSKLFSRIK